MQKQKLVKMNKILNKLNQLIHYCRQHDSYCNNCNYWTEEGNTNCVLLNIVEYMHKKNPEDWNIDEIKGILEC